MKVIRLMCLALLLLLTGCGIFSKTPPEQAIRIAIEQQLTQTQQSLAQELGLTPRQSADENFTPNFQVKQIKVARREKTNSPRPLNNSSLSEIYKVSGTFDAILTTPTGRTSQPDSPFEMYLATDPTQTEAVKTWFVIQSR